MAQYLSIWMSVETGLRRKTDSEEAEVMSPGRTVPDSDST